MNTKLNSEQFMQESTFPFWVNRTFHDWGNVPPVHSHDFIELIYVVWGKAQHLFEGERYDIRAGDVFIINPGEQHTYQIQQGEQLEIINCLFLPALIEETWLRKLGVSQSMDYFYVHPFLNKSERFHHRLNLRGKNADRVLAMLEMMIGEFELRRSGFSTLIRLQLVELLILLSRFYGEWGAEDQTGTVSSNQSYQLLVQRICGYLERHYDQKLSITDLCDMFNISTRQLNRIFKQETNKTVIEMIQHIRIERAKHLLLSTDEKIITIAGKVGYEDPAFFSRLFLRYVGYSPGKYRDHAK